MTLPGRRYPCLQSHGPGRRQLNLRKTGMRQGLSGFSSALVSASGSSDSVEAVEALPGVQNSWYRESDFLPGHAKGSVS